MGNLEIVWFDPRRVHAVGDAMDEGPRYRESDNAAAGAERCEGRPTKLHLKLTIVDEAIAVLGSGNMDRASWVTSQEVGVAVFSEEVAKRVGEVVRRVYG